MKTERDRDSPNLRGCFHGVAAEGGEATSRRISELLRMLL